MRPHPEVGLNYGSIAGSSAGVNAREIGTLYAPRIPSSHERSDNQVCLYR